MDIVNVTANLKFSPGRLFHGSGELQENCMFSHKGCFYQAATSCLGLARTALLAVYRVHAFEPPQCAQARENTVDIKGVCSDGNTKTAVSLEDSRSVDTR